MRVCVCVCIYIDFMTRLGVIALLMPCSIGVGRKTIRKVSRSSEKRLSEVEFDVSAVPRDVWSISRRTSRWSRDTPIYELCSPSDDA